MPITICRENAAESISPGRIRPERKQLRIVEVRPVAGERADALAPTNKRRAIFVGQLIRKRQQASDRSAGPPVRNGTRRLARPGDRPYQVGGSCRVRLRRKDPARVGARTRAATSPRREEPLKGRRNTLASCVGHRHLALVVLVHQRDVISRSRQTGRSGPGCFASLAIACSPAITLSVAVQSGRHADMTGSGVEQQPVADGRADRRALHPWRNGHVGGGATSLAMRGRRGSGRASEARLRFRGIPVPCWPR